MKRKLFILLALALLAAALFSATALAVEGPSFTVQPSIASFDGQSCVFRITWKTNFKPLKVEVRYKTTYGDYYYDELPESQLSANGAYDLNASGIGRPYYIRAFYGTGASDYIVSANLPVYNTDHQWLSFTTQPAIASFSGQSCVFRITWQTSFKPLKVEVRYKTTYGDYYYDELPKSQLSANGVYDLNASGIGRPYYIRAFYGTGTGDYIVSAGLPVYNTDHQWLSFTTQPAIDSFDGNALTYRITWQTSFKPLKVEVRYITTYGDYYYDELPESRLSADGTYDLPAAALGRNYYIRAFYGGGTGDYIDSDPFSTALRTVTFDAGGAEGEMASLTVVGNTTYTLPECAFTWAEHEFAGWRVGDALYQPGDEILISANRTIYAEWLAYYKVGFNGNGGSGSMPQVTVLEGTEYTLPECAYTYENHRFRTWHIANQAGNYDPGSRITITKNIVLQAQWNVYGLTVTFDMRGYGEQIAPIPCVMYDVISAPAEPAAAGKFFAGWYTTAGFQPTTRYDFTKPVIKNLTLYARWVDDTLYDVIVLYNEEHGTVTASSYAVREDEAVTLTATPSEHYSYDGFSIGAYSSSLNWFRPSSLLHLENPIVVRVGFKSDHGYHYASDANMTKYPRVEPTCEAEGHYTYYVCSICGQISYDYRDTGYLVDVSHADFDKVVKLPALGHEYGEPTYEWSEDHTSVTATRVCLHDASHVETETVSATGHVSAEPGCVTWGETTYVSEPFQNEAFAVQYISVSDIEPLGVRVDEVNFPDSVFRAYVSAKIDTDGSGTLSYDEWEAVTAITSTTNQYKNIVTFRGIEYFPNLETLYTQNDTVLEDLNLSGNPHLKTLTVTSCTSLKSLDLSANTELESLTVTFNGLTELDVSCCPQLRTLVLAGSRLARLDLSYNQQLTGLNVSSISTLTELDITRNAQLKTLYLQNTAVPAIDIHLCPYLMEAYAGTKTEYADHDRYMSGACSMYVDKDLRIFRDDMIVYGGLSATGGGILWRHNRGTGELYVYCKGETVIPDFEQGESPFAAMEDVTTVIVAGDVTAIGEHSFDGCADVTRVEIGEKVTAIGAHAFANCAALTDVEIPETVTSLGAYAFGGCVSLTSAKVPGGVEAIGSGCFQDCAALADVEIPYGVQRLGANAFNGCAALTEISLPDTVTDISEGAFAGCAQLAELTLSRNALSIGANAFNGCAALTAVDLPDGLGTVPEGVFAGCASLAEADIPDGVTAIGPSAFEDCAGLTDVTIPASVTAIDADAFSGCGALADVWFGSGSAEWTAIAIGAGNEALSAARLHFTPEELAVNADNFPDTAFRAYVAANFDADGTGWLNAEEIAQAAEINAYEYDTSGITSLEGIQFFPEISYLSIADSPLLTEADLSANAKIANIDIWDTGLSALDVSGMTLGSLSVARSPLTVLTLGEQPQLYLLSCPGAALTELDITGCPLMLDAIANGTYTVDNGRVTWGTNMTELTVDDGVRLITGLTLPVTFESRGGSAVDAQEVAFGEYASEPAAPVRIGAAFTGWYTDPACAEESRFSFDSPILTGTTLYAGWVEPKPAGILKLPANLTTIDEDAFAGIAAEAVIVPKTVTAISGDPFAGSAVLYIYGYPASAAEALAGSDPARYTFVPIDDEWLNGH